MGQGNRLAGKAAVVTGGSRGIGRGVALAFAREGARVAINHWQDEAAAQETLALLAAESHNGGYGEARHLALDADVGDPQAVSRMMADAVAQLGGLDILVNNAGFQAPTPGDSYDDALLARIVGVNLLGAAGCAKAALAHFGTRPGGGCIINTTSAHQMIPKPGYLAYSLSKGGMDNLTRTLALEFAAAGVRVNAVGPGATVTDINASWTGDAAARAKVEAHIPLGFAAEVEDITPAYLFLASDDARYITGQTLYACGGLTLFEEFRTNWAS